MNEQMGEGTRALLQVHEWTEWLMFILMSARCHHAAAVSLWPHRCLMNLHQIPLFHLALDLFPPSEKALQEQMCGNSLKFKWRENGLYRLCCISRNTSTQSPISSKWGWVTHSGNRSSLPSSGWQKWSHLRGAHLVMWHNNDCGWATFTESSSRHIPLLLVHYWGGFRRWRVIYGLAATESAVGVGGLLKCKGETCQDPRPLGGPYCRHITPCSQHSYWGICSLLGQNTRNVRGDKKWAFPKPIEYSRQN